VDPVGRALGEKAIEQAADVTDEKSAFGGD
jgi:hypothetical protein